MKPPLSIDRHAQARQQIASDAHAADVRQQRIERILHPVGIGETDPLDVPQFLADMEEFLEELRAQEFERKASRP